MRAQIYEDLSAINQATEQIMKRIASLRDAGVLTPAFSEIRLILTEQNCAEINVSVMHHLTTIELEDAGRLQQEGIRKQKKLSEK